LPVEISGICGSKFNKKQPTEMKFTPPEKNKEINVSCVRTGVIPMMTAKSATVDTAAK
jgi:hypothetical protein